MVESKTDIIQITPDKPQELIVSDAEQARINKWRERRAKESSSYKYAVDKDNKASFAENTISKKDESIAATMAAATGSISEDYSRIVLSQTHAALHKYDYGQEATLNAVHDVLLSLAPQDEFEGMLMRRILVLDNQCAQFLMTAARTDNLDVKERYINMATKLSRVQFEAIEALNKHKRKGQQNVLVTHNHVKVNSGGRAIVSSEITQQPGGGDHDKK